MLEPRSPNRPGRWHAALLLACGLLLAGAAVPAIAQEPEEPPAAVEPAPAEPAAESDPAEPEEAEPEPAEPEPAEPEEAEPAEELEEEARPERQRHRDRGHRKDAQVVVGSSLTIDEDETTEEVVVIGGSLTVLGEVYGDAVAIGGSVTVEGRVTGDVAAVGGSVILTEGAEVMGGAMSFGGSVVQDDDAEIRGEVVEVTSPGMHWAMWPRFLSWQWDDHDGDWFHHSPFDWALSQAWRIFGLVVLVLFAFLAYLLGRTPIERIGRRVEAEPWKSGLVGLASQILFVPLLILVVVILAVSIIGIPFLLLVPFALLAIGIAIFFGYVGVALKLGDLLRERFGWSIQSPYLVLLLGIVGLEIWTLIGHMLNFNGPPLRLFAGLFLLFGFLVCYVAWTLATGGAILTRFGTAESWARQPPPAAPLPPANELQPEPQAPGPAPEIPEATWKPESDSGEQPER